MQMREIDIADLFDRMANVISYKSPEKPTKLDIVE
jgi:hypothetical protein